MYVWACVLCFLVPDGMCMSLYMSVCVVLRFHRVTQTEPTIAVNYWYGPTPLPSLTESSSSLAQHYAFGLIHPYG